MHRRQQYIFMERWALDALQEYMATSTTALTEVPSTDERRTLMVPKSQVIMKEWNPDDDS